jgi:hypothetical protein
LTWSETGIMCRGEHLFCCISENQQVSATVLDQSKVNMTLKEARM